MLAPPHLLPIQLKCTGRIKSHKSKSDLNKGNMGEMGMGNREMGMGNREMGMGNREIDFDKSNLGLDKGQFWAG